MSMWQSPGKAGDAPTPSEDSAFTGHHGEAGIGMKEARRRDSGAGSALARTVRRVPPLGRRMLGGAAAVAGRHRVLEAAVADGLDRPVERVDMARSGGGDGGLQGVIAIDGVAE